MNQKHFLKEFSRSSTRAPISSDRSPRVRLVAWDCVEVTRTLDGFVCKDGLARCGVLDVSFDLGRLPVVEWRPEL